MSEIITKEQIPEYEAFIQSHPKGHFAQSVLWAKQKPMWKWEAIVSRDGEGRIKGSMSVLIRRIIPGLPFTMMYSCRGPVTDLNDRETLADLLEGAKKLAKKHHSYVIKIDPDVPSSETAYTEMLTSLGFTLTGGGATFDAIQPQYVFRLNTEGKTSEELLAALPQSTRRKVRAGGKKGVTTKICGKEAVPDFARLMLETGVRDGFVTREASYFESMLDNLGEHARLYMAYYEGQAIAGTLAIWFGDKVWYLYGASSNEHRNLMPNYMLQWNMIEWAVEKGCRLYDFRGVPGQVGEDHPLYGLYKFKLGFGGDYVEFVGEMDMVLNRPVNWFITTAKPIFMDLRKKLYLLKNKK
ncbi:MAG: peptidoglycan bridge formation glycyltransferase FemA/FemB family protein [Oscillospiraceae bacterium]|nr:peptidoglycan bridge formation glycyltransferase FemA/FemB family protein [Oscillospiraceae bacterium]